MLDKDGTILFEDNRRKIIKVTYADGSRAYKVKEMRKNCFNCNKRVHRDSGKLIMSELAKNLQTPKFFCHKCYVAVNDIINKINKERKQ